MDKSVSKPQTITGYNPSDTSPPTIYDRHETSQIIRLLTSRNQFETESGFKKRERLISNLESIAQNWSLHLIQMINPEHQQVQMSTYARILTYGSYRLGVCTPNDDVDSLLLFPSYVSRTDHFFKEFPSLLEKEPSISSVVPVPNAFVPVIKIVFEGISFDILYASLPLPFIPYDFDINDDGWLVGLDHTSIRSINGCRVASTLLSIIDNIASFRITLHFIKYWAHVRGIYGNIFGYLNGISWTILVGFICIFYPCALPSTLIRRFFQLFTQWKFQKSPVALFRIPYRQRRDQCIERMKDKAQKLSQLYPTLFLSNSSSLLLSSVAVPRPLTAQAPSLSPSPPSPPTTTTSATPPPPAASVLNNGLVKASLAFVEEGEKTEGDIVRLNTPAVPTMNSAHNVNQFTYAVIREEFARGWRLLSREGEKYEDEDDTPLALMSQPRYASIDFPVPLHAKMDPINASSSTSSSSSSSSSSSTSFSSTQENKDPLIFPPPIQATPTSPPPTLPTPPVPPTSTTLPPFEMKPSPFTKLIKPNRVFKRYRKYLQITVSTIGKENQKKWFVILPHPLFPS